MNELFGGEASRAVIWGLSVTAYAVVSAGTPGPNNTMLAASGARFGLRRTVPHICGVVFGYPLMFVVVALGLAAPLRAWPWFFVTLRIAGFAYLLWLAIHIARERVDEPDVATTEVGTGAQPMTFTAATLFQWINPKAWIMAATAVVAYVHPGAHAALEIAGAALIFLAVNPFATTAWTLVGVGTGRLASTPSRKRALNYAMAALLVASLLPMIFER